MICDNFKERLTTLYSALEPQMILIYALGGLSAFLILVKVYLKATTGRCTSGRSLVGKTVIVTGSNTGIGKEAAFDFAQRGARVILACRNKQRAFLTAVHITKETGNQEVLVRELDLTSFKSIRYFAEGFLQMEDRLDILVNNAGMIGTPDRQVTADGIELQLQTNHLGPFLLTNLLLPKLKACAPSRIVMVASAAHRAVKRFDFDDLQGNVHYSPFKIYGHTKLANILFTRYLANQLVGTGVTINALHPGVIATELYRNFSGAIKALFKVFEAMAAPFLKSFKEGAQTTIFLAVDEQVDQVSGQYFADCKPKKPTRLAQDEAVAKKLWELSETLTKL